MYTEDNLFHGARLLSLWNIGTIVDSRYEIVEHIGDGGMGSVFKVREIGLERFVALKVLHPILLGDAENRERFKREGAVLSSLQHPNLLQCFRFGIWNDVNPYIAMEFVTGATLSSLIASERLSSQMVLGIGQQICSAMQHVHEKGVIHRDLKPANVMIAQENSQYCAKVLDFGLARSLPGTGVVSQQLTQTGDLVGSIYYMSPEQCLGKKSDARSDIYSLGCLLYEALCGAPPLIADTPVGVISLHTTTCPEPLEKRLGKSRVPAGLNAVLMRAMSKDPAERYQAMAEFQAALHMVECGRGNEIPPSSASRQCVADAFAGKKFAMPAMLLALMCVAILVPCFIAKTQKIAVFNSSSDKSRLLPRNLGEVDCFSLTGPERQEKIRQLETWLKRYGAGDLIGRMRANHYLFRLCRIGESPDDRLASMYYGRRARADLESLRRSPAELKRIGPEKISSIVINFDDLFCSELGKVQGLRTFLREYGSLIQYPLKDDLIGGIAGVLSNTGAYRDEEILRRSISRTRSDEKLLWARCLYRQKRFSEAKNEVTSTFVPSIPIYRFDYFHQAVEALLEMGCLTEANLYLEGCSDTGPPSSSLLNSKTPLVHQRCDNEAIHAFYKGLTLSLQKKYGDANQYLMKVIADAPVRSKSRFCEGLLPLAIRNGEQGRLRDAQRLAEDILPHSKAGDTRWMLSVARICAKSHPELSRRLTDKCIQLEHTESPHGVLTVRIANVLLESERPHDALEFLVKALSRPDQKNELELRIKYAKALLASGRATEAERQLQVAERLLGSTSGAVQRELLLTQGAVFRAQRRLKECDEVMGKAISLMGDNSDADLVEKVAALEAYSEICRSMGRNDLAETLLGRADLLLPVACRGPWKSWKQLSPDYPHQRPFLF